MRVMACVSGSAGGGVAIRLGTALGSTVEGSRSAHRVGLACLVRLGLGRVRVRAMKARDRVKTRGGGTIAWRHCLNARHGLGPRVIMKRSTTLAMALALG